MIMVVIYILVPCLFLFQGLNMSCTILNMQYLADLVIRFSISPPYQMELFLIHTMKQRNGAMPARRDLSMSQF